LHLLLFTSKGYADASIGSEVLAQGQVTAILLGSTSAASRFSRPKPCGNAHGRTESYVTAARAKDFLQCLTLAHAKELLRAGKTILGTAFEAGLSGPSRLHDLCVELEAASPGEMKLGGNGWAITAGFANTPFGKCLIGESPRGICHLSFIDSATDAEALSEIREAWPNARLVRRDASASRIANRIFSNAASANHAPLRALVSGSAFQVRVWRALLGVQPGALTTYGRLAEAIGQSGASRAVGSAIGKNPVAYLIPCHRVIRETGVLGHYRWNALRKRAMLAWESGRERRRHDP